MIPALWLCGTPANQAGGASTFGSWRGEAKPMCRHSLGELIGIIEMTPGCFFVSLQSRSSLRERCLLRVSTFFVDNRCVSDSQDWKGTIDDAQATPCAGHPTAHPVLCDSLPTDRIRPHPVSAPVTHVTYGLAASLLPCAVTIAARSCQNPRGDLVPMCSASAASRLLPHMAPLNFASRGL